MSNESLDLATIAAMRFYAFYVLEELRVYEIAVSKAYDTYYIIYL